MRRQNIYLMTAILVIAAFPVHAQTRDRYGEKLRVFEDFVRDQMKSDKTVGITIGFIKDDYTWVKAFGYSDLENKVAMKPESAYRLASVTKTMTAMAVLQLVEQGKVNLDDEIQKYVPYFPKKKFPVTVRELLGHLGGITAYRTEAEERIREYKNTREAVAIFADYDLVAEPNTLFSYSSYGYILLGALIESASGKSYGEYLRQNIWAPLGMNDTRMDDPLDVIPNRVRGYQLVNGQLKNSEYVNISSRFASGGTRSTIFDLLKFSRGLIAGRLLKPSTYAEMWTPMTTKNGRFTPYGMGWWADAANGRFVVSHGGSQNETQTALIIVPSQHFAIAVAMNFENAVPYPYAEQLYRTILDEPRRINVYSKLERDRVMLRALDESFVYGVRYFDKYQKPISTDSRELADAFAYFNSIPTLPAKDAADRVSNGRHPQSDQAFVKMASFIASKVHTANPRGFDDYFRRGAIPLFADYVRLYKTDTSVSAELRFTPEFERQLDGWNRDWARTWTDETRSLDFSVNTDLQNTGKVLRDLFKGATVYPNFEPKLESITDTLVASGDTAKAIEAATLATEIYPENAGAFIELGMTYTVVGDRQKALTAFRKAKELDAGVASADTLNRYAYFLVDKVHIETGIQMLEAAVELYPREANLYDSIGELFAKLGQRSKAIESYEKALELDPKYPNAENARAALKKLRQ